MENPEESSPLLGPQLDAPNHEKEAAKSATAPPPAAVAASVAVELPKGAVPPTCEWTADGLPLGYGITVGEPLRRTPWSSGFFACLGHNDDFCSSDLEVCLLGSVAPCVLYGSNVERLSSVPGTFSNHCLRYAGLYLIGNSLLGWNGLAPWFSYRSRTAIRRTFNLEGSCGSSCGCCGRFLDDEECESLCDSATHIFCHACALCQEARELRRRLPHPGFKAQPQVLVMIPPGDQTMGRDGD